MRELQIWIGERTIACTFINEDKNVALISCVLLGNQNLVEKKKKGCVFRKVAKKLVCSEYNTLMLLLNLETDSLHEVSMLCFEGVSGSSFYLHMSTWLLLLNQNVLIFERNILFSLFL